MGGHIWDAIHKHNSMHEGLDCAFFVGIQQNFQKYSCAVFLLNAKEQCQSRFFHTNTRNIE